MQLHFPTCHDLLDAFAGFGERPLIEWREGSQWRHHSAASVAGQVRGIARGLHAAGITPGDRVAILRGSGPEYPLLVLGAIASGAIALLLDPGLSAPELSAQLRQSSPRLLLCSVGTRSLAAAATAGMDLPILADWAQLAATPEAKPLPDHDTFAPCVLAFTSGSSGSPKGVLLSWGRVAFQIEQAGALLHRPGQAFVSVLPPHHLLELVAGILMPLSRGERVVFANTLLPTELLRLVRERDAGYMIIVPPLLELMATQLGSWQPGPSFTGFICGGAALPERLLHRCAAHGVLVLQGYGLTEAGPVLATNTPLANKPGTVGRPMPGVELRFGVDGSIQARCPFPHGYCHAGSTLPRSTAGEWIDTGDLGELDADGFLRIVGRSKLVIVLANGKKVHPEEVETVLGGEALAGLVQDICVLGLPSRFEGSDEVAAVVWPGEALRAVHPGEQMLPALLQAMEPTRAALASWKWPSRFIIAAAPLPRSSQHKLLRDLIRKRYLESPA